MPELSIIVPAYNEESRLPATLQSVWEFLYGDNRDFELLVVDDGSMDSTPDIVEHFARTHTGVRLVSYAPNRGKGYAVRAGIMAARGDLLLINDADGSSPIEELLKLERSIADGADLAIGSRAKPDDTRVVAALAYRKFIGNTFNLIVQGLVLPGIYDTQCGFKLFKRDVARDIFSVSRLNGYGFDVEILYVAKSRGYKISEIPINWTNVPGSKVNVLVDSPRMLLEVFGIAVDARLGRYRPGRQRPRHERLTTGWHDSSDSE
jgi:dolichyl-phosphate beta-glucosyltransferase